MSKTKILFLLIFINSSLSLAQKPGIWEMRLSGGLSTFKGNVEKFDGRSDVAIIRADSIMEYSLLGKLIYSENQHTTINKEYSAVFKADLYPDSRLSPFVATTFYNNKYKGIYYRYSFLTGAKLVFFQNTSTKYKSVYTISAAVQYDIEKYILQNDTIKDLTNQKELMRYSIRPKFQQKLGNIMLEHVTFIKPNITNFKDFQIDSETKLSVDIIEKFLILSLIFDYNYINLPPQSSILKEDYALTINFLFKINAR